MFQKLIEIDIPKCHECDANLTVEQITYKMLQICSKAKIQNNRINRINEKYDIISPTKYGYLT